MSSVSVIMSVYNAEPFLRRSLDSLAAQTFRNGDFLCINDGSTDGSLAVLQEYARRDSRFRVISLKANVGLAKARNVGLLYATGDYVCTLDADDWLSPDALESAVAVFEAHPQTDCVLLQLVFVDAATGEQKRFPMDDFEMLPGADAMKRSLDWDGIHGLYLTRTGLHQRFSFDVTTRVYSDENTTRYHFLVAREVRQCAGIYYYWQHGQSVTHRVSLRYLDHLRANEHLLEELCRMGADDEALQRLHDKLWLSVVDCYAYVFAHRGELPEADYRQAMAEIQRMWARVDTRRVSSVKYKFGYMPLRFSFAAFRLQEEIYFGLRRLLHRL